MSSAAYGAADGASAGDGGDALQRKVSSLVFRMTTSVNSYKKGIANLGSNKDDHALRASLKTQRESIAQMAKETSFAVKRLMGTDGGGGEGSAQHARMKCVQDFHAVLKEFQRAQRLAASKSGGGGAFAGAESASSATATDDVDAELAGGGGYRMQEKQSLLQESRRREKEHTEGEMEFNDALIQERERGILEIQQQIGEVNEIFQDLAVLVNEQGSMIDDIEANIVSTASRTKDAQRELSKADASQKAARNRMLCLVVTIAIVLTILWLVLLN